VPPNFVGLPLSTTLFELRSKPLCGDKAPGVAILTVAEAPICDCALLTSSAMVRTVPA